MKKRLVLKEKYNNILKYTLLLFILFIGLLDIDRTEQSFLYLVYGVFIILTIIFLKFGKSE